MFRSLLIPLDGTPFGEHAVPMGVSVARRCQAVLELAHVHVPPIAGGKTTALEDTSYLEDIAGRIVRHAPELVIHTRLLTEERPSGVADLLAKHAAEVGADLIVLNSHARGGVARWWMGSVADDLIHRSTIPLLVAPALEKDAGVEDEPVFRHILIALDGSPLAEQVIPTAMTLAGTMNAELTLLRIVEPALIAVGEPAMVAPMAGPAFDELAERDAEGYLDRLAARLRGTDATRHIATRVLVDPEPAEAICGFLRRNASWSDREPDPPDLVAMATRGREGLARLLLGSVSDRVLQHTPIPLLLQRPVVSR